MICPLCKTAMVAQIEITGGCAGHDANDPCYCDSLDVRVEFGCSNNSPGEYRRTSKYNNTWIPNQSRCKQQPIRPAELSCARSIERWLSKHYPVEIMETI